MGGPTRLHGETRRILEAAGWHVDRAVDTARWEAELVADGFPQLHPVDIRFLSEFGGLVVPHGGAGVTRARESLTLVPTDCSGEADRFAAWGKKIGRNIAPIGELAGGTCSWANLGIDEHGDVYLVIDRLATFGCMPRALDRLVLGHMPRDIT
ncbi:SUKH-3 domain-containing protein [Actinoplanes sp. NPDC023936]|uniref:SUKH-3 domain-containing protein n=1 Tax=Actinoplanes sp. NPDC023936 TaxID=3154910 RepID=UPI0033D90002